jgi:hypothetical protein
VAENVTVPHVLPAEVDHAVRDRRRLVDDVDVKERAGGEVVADEFNGSVTSIGR